MLDSFHPAVRAWFNRRFDAATDAQLAGWRAIAEGRDARTRVADVMTRDPDVIACECTAIDALRMMSDGGYRHLPIVRDGELVGIVSRGDFKGLELDRLEEETSLWERIC